MKRTVNYNGYQAKNQPRAQEGVRRLPRRIARFLKVDVLYNTLLFPYGQWRHRALLRTVHRSQAHTYTCFYRSPVQLEALTGPVLDYLATGAAPPAPLRILVFACSTGAEAYTLAAVLRKAHPQLDFHIQASDLHEEMVSKAAAGIYSKDEVLHSPHIGDDFLADTFDRSGDQFIVKPVIRSLVSFTTANLLGGDLPERFAPADIVFAQNVLFHLDPAAARTAFVNVAGRLKPRGVLFVEGVDLDLKVALTRELGLSPLDYKHREIYDHSRSHISLAWWNYYYGVEPYSLLRGDRIRRYSSIFTR